MGTPTHTENRSDEIDTLHRRHFRTIARQCARIIRDEDQAEDLTQEAFVRVHRRATERGGAVCLPLLLATARNLALNHARNRRRREELLRVETTPLGVFDDEKMDSKVDARRLLGALPEDRQRLLELYFVRGWTMAEIADDYGISPSGVRKRLLGSTATLSQHAIPRHRNHCPGT